MITRLARTDDLALRAGRPRHWALTEQGSWRVSVMKGPIRINKSDVYLRTTDMARRAKLVSCDDLRVHNGLMVQPPNPDLETEHSKFRSDVEAVRRYGESHVDDYVEELFENEPHIRLIVLMVGDHLAEHEMALRELVDHPDQLEVRQTPFSKSQLEEIRREVNQTARANSGAFMQWGIGRGRVNVQLAADREDLAESFHKRFGDAVELRVGVFPFPPDSDADQPEKEPRAVAHPKLPLLPSDEFEVSLENEIVISSGGTKSGKLRIHNHGSAEVVIETNGGVTARIVDSQTGEGGWRIRWCPSNAFDQLPDCARWLRVDSATRRNDIIRKKPRLRRPAGSVGD